MTSDSHQESDTVTRVDRPQGTAPRLAGSCDGCRELTARIERLEQALALATDDADPDRLSTTRCYWICVGVHALCALLMYCNEPLIQFAMMISIGAVATQVVCQVLSTRPVHHRVLRSLLSISVVTASAMFGLWLADIAAPAEIIPFLVMLFPPVFAGAWLIAKLFLWIGGWRIVPPNYTTQYARLQIQHLLLGTMLIAAYLALGRLLADEIESWLSDDLMVTIVYLILPVMMCTVVSCLLARTVLNSATTRVVSYCLILGFATVPLMAIAFVSLLAVLSDMSIDGESLLAVLMYAIPLTMGVCASSGGTFAMMRLAKYRFHSRRHDVALLGPVETDAGHRV